MKPGWFHRSDLKLPSKKARALLSAYGFAVGFAAAGFFLLFFGVVNEWLAYGTTIGGITGLTVGLSRNKIVILVANRGFPSAFYFHRLAYWSQWAGIVIGGVGLAFGRGWIGTINYVLPFAAGFILLIYFYVAFFPVYNQTEEGRLLICQFLTESSVEWRGYSWLRRGLLIVEQCLRNRGVAVQRNRLFYGAGYSLMEGSFVESDRYGLYLVGEWSSQPETLYPVYDVARWFLYRSRQGDRAGFSVPPSVWDRVFGPSAQRKSESLTAMLIIVTLAAVIVGILQVISH